MAMAHPSAEAIVGPSRRFASLGATLQDRDAEPLGLLGRDEMNLAEFTGCLHLFGELESVRPI